MASKTGLLTWLLQELATLLDNVAPTRVVPPSIQIVVPSSVEVRLSNLERAVMTLAEIIDEGCAPEPKPPSQESN